MAFIVKSYGNGSLGDVSEIEATPNSYARVTAVTANSITLSASGRLNGMATFTVGAKILIHVSAVASDKKTYLGRWLLANVTEVNGDVLTLDEKPTTCIPTAQLANYYVQAIAVAEFKNLTLNAGTIVAPPNYLPSSHVGGIVAIMCSDTLKFNGGHISLTDRGIPIANKALRPTSSYHDSKSTTGQHSGNENSETRRLFFLNAGDGAAFIIAKKLICHDDSRIGNISTYGCQFYRGDKNAVTYGETAPTNVTNVGGSTILIAALEIENFGHKMLAKYRSSTATAGQGICRCYIASETKLRNDEGLYAYDCISNPNRIKNMNIKDYGDGSFGNGSALTTQLNNYATVTAIEGNKITYTNETTAGLASFTTGALVMIHFNHRNSTNVEHSGRFILAKVLADNGSYMTIDTTPPDISITDYACQIVSIPQFNNFTLAKENAATVKFNGKQGGICAIAVKGTCNLTKGKLNVMKKGGGTAYGRPGLAVIGNAQNSDRLPIGQGHGSIFILAQNLTLATTTRLGHTSSGSGAIYYKYGGGGAAGGSYGGYGSNGTKKETTDLSASMYQGAHIMIVANKITGFDLKAICTGGNTSFAGCGGGYESPYGYNGGKARFTSNSTTYYVYGSAGWCFVYCNNAASPTTTHINYSN